MTYWNSNRAKAFVAILALAPSAGCSMAWPASKMLPPATVVGHRAAVPTTAVRLYREAERVDRPFAQIAQVAAHGNGYATRATLEGTLTQQAAQLGADAVIVLGQNVTKDETVGAYGGGMMIANQIQRPHLYGIAIVWQKVRMGVTFFQKDGKCVAMYVAAGSQAERAGIKEGDQLLAIDGQFIGDDKFNLESVLYRFNPDDNATFELLNSQGEKRVVKMTFDAVPPI